MHFALKLAADSAAAGCSAYQAIQWAISASTEEVSQVYVTMAVSDAIYAYRIAQSAMSYVETMERIAKEFEAKRNE